MDLVCRKTACVETKKEKLSILQRHRSVYDGIDEPVCYQNERMLNAASDAIASQLVEADLFVF